MIPQDTTTAQGKKRTEVSRGKKGTCYAHRIKERCSVVICHLLVHFVLINLSLVETRYGSYMYPVQSSPVSFFLRKATAVHRLNTAGASRIKVFLFFCSNSDSFSLVF